MLSERPGNRLLMSVTDVECGGTVTRTSRRAWPLNGSRCSVACAGAPGSALRMATVSWNVSPV